MTKIVFKDFKLAANGITPSVSQTSVTGPDGKILRVVRTVDANSATFGTDLLHVFRQNVSEALASSESAPEPDKNTPAGKQ